MHTPRIYTRREIEGLIAGGDNIIVLDDTVLRLNAWKAKHPGGGLVIEHMVGRDASTEIKISHSPEIVKSMLHFRIGRIEGPWDNFVPPIQGGMFRKYEEVDIEDIAVAEEELSAFEDSGYSSEGTASCTTAEEVQEKHVKHAAAKKAMLSPDEYTASKIQDDVDADLAAYPSIDPATQRDIAVRFQALHQRIRDEGYYDCRGSEYAKEISRYSLLFAIFAGCLHQGWYFTSACFLGLFWQQIMFTAHDAGHRGITHDITTDTLIGIFIGNLCCGLSIGWWKSSHNVHHLVTNSPEHDPDIQNVPLFSTSPFFFTSIKSSYYGGFIFPWDAAAAFASQYQVYIYYPIMALARFNLYFLSWAHLISSRSATKGKMWWTRPTEAAAISIYIFLYFYILLYRCIPTWQSRAVFLLMSHIATLPLHVQITLSHWGTSTADLGPTESFAQKQLRTTMDVECPQWLDFIHGGLQFQAVHHLFPRVPRHNLRALQVLVREFCAETKIEYLIHGFAKGNGVVLNKLEEIAQQAKMLSACQAHMAATGESGLH